MSASLREWIRDVGFPIAITLYLLARMEPLLQRLDTDHTHLRDTAARLELRMEDVARLCGAAALRTRQPLPTNSSPQP